MSAVGADVTVVRGDVFDVDQVARAAEACDAAICTIGAPGGFLGRGTTTVYSRAAASLTAASAQADVRRVVFCTSARVEAHDPGEVLIYRLLAKPLFLQPAYDDVILAEQPCAGQASTGPSSDPHGSPTDPPPATTARAPLPVPRGEEHSRGDVAAFMLDQLIETRWSGQTPTLTT